MTLDNGQISGRQCERTLFIELFGMSVFLETGALTGICGKKCFAMLLFGSLISLGIGLLFWYFQKNQTISYGKQMHNVWGKWGIFVSILYVLRFAFRGGFILCIFYKLISGFLLRDVSFHYIVVPLLLVCGYGASKGREKRLRGTELLFWFVVVPFFIILLLVYSKVDVSNFSPKTDVSEFMKRNPKGIYASQWGFFIPVALFSNVEFFLFLCPKIREEDRSVKNLIWPVVLATIFHLMVMIGVVGVLGYPLVSEISQPVLRVMESATVPGAFVERLDIFLLAFWIFAVFTVLSGCIYYGSRMLRDNCYYLKHRTYYPWETWFVVLVLYAMSIFCRNVKDLFATYLRFSLWIDLPLAVLSAWGLWYWKRKGYGKCKKGK